MKRAKTYYKLDYHLVFIIKDRFEIIDTDLMVKIRQVAIFLAFMKKILCVLCVN